MANGQKSLRIGFLFDDTLDSNDGVAQYVKTLGAWLSGQGHDVSYLVGQTKLSSWASGKVHSMTHNMPVVFNGNSLSVPLPASRRRIKKILREADFDVIHVQVPHSPLMSGRVINRASPKTAIVGTFHIFPDGRLTMVGAKILRYLYGRGLGRFDRVVSVSSAASSFARQAFGINTSIIPNMIDLKRFKSVNTKSRADIVFLGRLVPRKGSLELLRAFTALHSRMPEIRLVIAGDGPERPKLEKFVKENELNNKVTFLGYIDEINKPGLLANARIACFPSLGGESFGIVLIEAMASGAGVVIGGDNPGYRSVLGDQPELLVDPTDTKLLASRLEHFLNDKKAAGQMHAWQEQHVSQYDVKDVGNQIIKLYRDAIAKHG